MTAPGRRGSRGRAAPAARAVPRWEDQDFVGAGVAAGHHRVRRRRARAARWSASSTSGSSRTSSGRCAIAAPASGSSPTRRPRATSSRPTSTASILSPGPGDPARLEAQVALARAVIDDGRPLLGICLGHQIVGRAAGADTRRLRFGHHGANHPVQDVELGLVQVTAQNHEVQVVGDSLPARRGSASARSTSTTARSRACATPRSRSRPSSTTRRARPGPLDALAVFDRFVAAARGERP